MNTQHQSSSTCRIRQCLWGRGKRRSLSVYKIEVNVVQQQKFSAPKSVSSVSAQLGKHTALSAGESALLLLVHCTNAGLLYKHESISLSLEQPGRQQWQLQRTKPFPKRRRLLKYCQIPSPSFVVSFSIPIARNGLNECREERRDEMKMEARFEFT